MKPSPKRIRAALDFLQTTTEETTMSNVIPLHDKTPEWGLFQQGFDHHLEVLRRGGYSEGDIEVQLLATMGTVAFQSETVRAVRRDWLRGRGWTDEQIGRFLECIRGQEAELREHLDRILRQLGEAPDGECEPKARFLAAVKGYVIQEDDDSDDPIQIVDRSSGDVAAVTLDWSGALCFLKKLPNLTGLSVA